MATDKPETASQLVIKPADMAARAVNDDASTSTRPVLLLELNELCPPMPQGRMPAGTAGQGCHDYTYWQGGAFNASHFGSQATRSYQQLHQPALNLAARAQTLRRSIAGEPGILWKIWTIEEGTSRFGSTYLFRSREDLDTYREMHLKRLASIGITVASDHIFDIMEEVSAITRAPLSA